MANVFAGRRARSVGVDRRVHGRHPGARRWVWLAVYVFFADIRLPFPSTNISLSVSAWLEAGDGGLYLVSEAVAP